jgi:phage shock protein PspC (stress-responsive transcriptional regulator)
MHKFRRMPDPVAGWLGVCSGLAYWLELPTWLVRLGTVMFVIAGGLTPFIFYVLVGWLAPEADTVPLDYEEKCE